MLRNSSSALALALMLGLVSPVLAQTPGPAPAPTGSTPTGAAGGDLSGTYPNPGVAKVAGNAWPTVSVSGDLLTFSGTGGAPADSGTLLSSLAPLASPTFTGGAKAGSFAAGGCTIGASAICTTGELAVSTQLRFSGTASLTVPGTMGLQAGTGQTFWCKTGTVSDCQFYDNSGAVLWNNPTGTNVVNFTSAPTIAGSAVKIPLSATTPGVGGAALLAGACGPVTVGVAGSTTAMAVVATPVTFPGDGFFWYGYVSTNGTVTVKICASIAGTPSSSLYNVRVLQ